MRVNRWSTCSGGRGSWAVVVAGLPVMLAVALTAGCAVPSQDAAATSSGATATKAPATTPSAAARPTPLLGNGSPNPGTRYAATDVPVPFSFTVPLKGGVQGSWMYGAGPQLNLGLRNSPQTGRASTVFASLDEVYDPKLQQPFVGKTQTVSAPQDADGWARWLEETGAAQVVRRDVVEVDGVRVVRLRVDVAPDLPSSSGFPCVAEESCLALSPRGPALVGATGSRRYASEVAVFEAGGRILIAASTGAADTVDQWLPLMHAVQESVQLLTP